MYAIPTQNEVLRTVMSLPLVNIKEKAAVRYLELLRAFGVDRKPDLEYPIAAILDQLEMQGKVKLIRSDPDKSLIYGIQVSNDY